MNPASMNPAPPSPPPSGPAHPLMRALTGPLLLTTLGVLLAIDYSGGITFGRTWPVLLIVFGLCKMAEHMGPRAA
jgi:hypothetical protein